MAMEMRGSLNLSKFRNTPNQPTYYGKCLINGVEYHVKGWEKENNGQPWISLLFETEMDRGAVRSREFSKPVPQARPEVDFSDMDKEIPF